MEPTIKKLVYAACPDFPEDREVKGTRDTLQWYKIVAATKTLMVPPANVLRVNMLELDRFIESVNAFAKCDPTESRYDWDHLNLYEAHEPEDILAMIQEIEEVAQDGWIACDIETRGLDWEDNCLLSIGFATDENTCYALHNIPIDGAKHSSANPGYEKVLIWDHLQQLFNNPNIKWCWHNGKFDCGKLKYLCNLDAHIDDDTMLLHYVGINEKRGTHGLKDLGQLYLQAPAWEDELDRIKKDYCKKHKIKLSEFYYDLIPTEVLIPYMQRDCIATRRLLTLFKELQRPGSEFIYGQLIRAANVYEKVELAGVQLDFDYLEDLEYELDEEARVAQEKLDAVASQIWDPVLYSKMTSAKITKNSEKFNPKSPKQLKWMLGELLGYPVQSTDALFMNELLERCENGMIDNPLAKDFIESIMAVRKNHKYMDTYVCGLRQVMCRDYRIRGTFNLHGTETGRLSSTNPNMQNIPRDKKIKNLLCAKPGSILVQMDYSQAELRVLAMLSGDESMIQCYIDDEDLHAQVAKDIFGPDFTKEQRTMAKTINFGIAYGRGPSSISENFHVSMVEARNIINKWFASKPKVKKYIDTQRAKPLKGEDCVTMLGRMRHFVITDSEINHIQNEYINTPIQSVASDMTMLSLLEIYDWLQDQKIADKAKIVTTVHDSIILEVADEPELVQEVAQKCQEIMAHTPKKFIPDCPVPFKADVEVGYSWGKLVEMEDYVKSKSDSAQ